MLTGALSSLVKIIHLYMDFLLNHNKKLREYRVRKILKEAIEPEEILLDAAKAPELEDQKIEVPIRPKTFRLFLWLIVAVFLVLVGQSFYLQIIKGATYGQMAERNSIRSFPIFASRGIIYDRTMKQLVYNVPSFDLVVTPQDLPKDLSQRNLVIGHVANIVGLAEEEIVGQIEKFDFRVAQSFSLSSNLEHEKVLVLESQIAGLPGFRIENNAVRQYIFSPYLSNVLGYLGKMAAGDLKNNPDYFMTEKIGKDGLEQAYEKILRGQPGEKLIEVDAQGRQKSLLSESEPKDGLGLVLTIDNELQKQIYEKLKKTVGKLGLKKAAAVAIDPRSGGVLALVSLPSFDNNIFAGSLSVDDYANLKNDPNQPLFNRALSGQYAPGSTVKPFIGAAALQEGVISKYTTIFDPGELVLANQYNPEIIYRFPDWKAHGTVDIYTAIAQSCDVFFYTIGGGYGNIEGLGLERLEEYFGLFGFGAKLGIDLPGEASGLVPSAAWKKEAKNEQWYTGDTYHISIGQGDLLVTPLQLAAATASLANDGKLLAPHLVDKIIDSDKNIINTIQSKILRANFVSSENLDVIKKGMRQAVTVGSAHLLNDLTIPVAAKTGTAQVAGQKNPNAWVSLFAPYDNPQIALVILVENAGEGSQVAVPIAKEILEEYFNK